MVKEHPDASEKLRGKKIAKVLAAIIPVEQARRIYGRRMLLVGDAAGMVEPFSAGGNEYAMRGGVVAGRVAASALETNNFSEQSLSEYETQWKRTADYKTLTSMQRLLTLGYYYYRINKNAPINFYAFFFHKVADLVAKGMNAPGHTLTAAPSAA